jgi:hypothetical protein
MDLDNMLLLLKQSAPIGIIALGMTVIMINGNIDLSVGATYALAGIVMLDSMTWPFMEAMGDWVIPLAWLFALLTGVSAGADQRPDRVEDRSRCLHRHAGCDARLPRPRLHVQWREADLPPELDAGRFRRGAVSSACRHPQPGLLAVVLIVWLVMTARFMAATPMPSATTARRRSTRASASGRT